MSEPSKTTVLLIMSQAIGVQDGNKKGNQFYLISEAEWEQARQGSPIHLEVSRQRIFSQKVGKLMFPGSVFSIAATDAKAQQVTPGTERFVGNWPDEQQVLQWKAQHEAWKALWEEEAQRKKLKDRDPIAELLAPLRDAYRKTISKSRRAALLARIITYITG